MVTLVPCAVAALLIGAFVAGWVFGQRSHAHTAAPDAELRSLRAVLERLGERVSPVQAATTADGGEIPDGIVHDDVREQINALARKWGATPRFVLRCAVTFQVVRAWKDELQGERPSGEVMLNVTSAVDDTSAMFEPGYAEEIDDEPPSMRGEEEEQDDDDEDAPSSRRASPQKPTKH